MKFHFIIYICFTILVNSNSITPQLIISMLVNNQNETSINSSINSILNQNIDQSLYKIVLIISRKNKNQYLSNEYIKFIDEKGIQLKVTKKKYNFQNRLITTFRQWPDNPILLINDNLIFPEGWLEMYINAHKKYPNDIIASSIQYFIGQKLEIKIFSEGYKGKYFGTFNHISDLVFNFAFVNIELGGALFPPKTFRNNIFYDLNLFSLISPNSIDFWISCFIMIENRVLRQSLKIFDFSNYIINKNEFINENSIIYEQNLRRMLFYFPWFKKIVHKRQKKVIISLTSYPQRFEFLPSVFDSIKNQSLLIKNVELVLSKKEKKLFKNNISGIDIMTVKKDLKPHKKYYYTMSKYRDYAILALDDDTIYCNNMVKSLFNSYLDHPNIVSGRAGHFMKYKKNGELSGYLSWFLPTKSVKNIDYNIFLIGVGGIIYPPDILNINENNLGIIRDFLIGDDFVLKHLEIKKGIESRLIRNNHPQGLYMKNNSFHKPLYDINKYRNDIYIKKINTAIDNEIIKDLCINYKNIKTGLTIYLFNINNIIINETTTTFYIDAVSFCPIENILDFEIIFNKFRAFCVFNQTTSFVEENLKIHESKIIRVAFCFINKRIKNLNKFLFLHAISINNYSLFIKNKINYIPIIFNDFYNVEKYNYILKLIFFKSYPKNFNFYFELDNIKLNCTLKEEVKYNNDIKPVIKEVNCFNNNNNDINKRILISGLPKKNSGSVKAFNKKISNIFIISRIFLEKINISNFIVIKGQLNKNLNSDINDLKIVFHYPKKLLLCNIQNGSRFIQNYIYCEIAFRHSSEVFLENQLIYSETFDYNLLLINSETLLQNYRTIKNNNDYQIININILDDLMNIKILIFLLFLLLIKYYIIFNNHLRSRFISNVSI